MTDIVRGTSRTSTEPLSSAPEHVGQGSLRLGHDDIRVQSSTEHVAPLQAPVSHKRLGGQVRELAQRPPPQLASLRNRTVPRAQARGALAGALAMALGVGGTAGVLFGIGKAALIGAAVGSIIPGVGTAVGGVIGGFVGVLAASGIGALIGRLVAGGGSRDKAEKLTIGLLNQGKITRDEASALKGMSNSELKSLVSISARKTGITSKADRDDIRRAVLLTAAKQGPDEARRLKAELLNLKSPTEAGQRSLAAIGARNRIALQPHLTANQDPRFAAIRENPLRLGEYQRFMQDAVAQESRDGKEVTDEQLRALSGQALKHVGKFTSDEALRTYQNRRRDFETQAQSFMQLATQDPRPDLLAGKLIDLRQSFEAMWRAKNGDEEFGADDLATGLEAAFARAASGAPAPDIARRALDKLLGENSALRTVHGAMEDIVNDFKRPVGFANYAGAMIRTTLTTLESIGRAVGEPVDELADKFDGLPAPTKAMKQQVINALEPRIQEITGKQQPEEIEELSLDDESSRVSFSD